MGKLTDVCLKKPSRSKKNDREEKKNFTVEKKTPTPKPEVTAADPVAPKVPTVHRKKKETSKEKGIVIVEGTPEARKSPSIPAGDKGKGIMHQPSPPPKRQKINPHLEPRQVGSVDEPAMPAIDLRHRLTLKGAASPVEVATASAAVSRVVHSLNSMGGDLWSKLSVDNPTNLLDIGIHASVLLRTPFLVYLY